MRGSDNDAVDESEVGDESAGVEQVREGVQSEAETS